MDTLIRQIAGAFARWAVKTPWSPGLLRYACYELLTWAVIVYFLLRLVPGPLGKRLQKGYAGLLPRGLGFTWRLVRTIASGLWRAVRNVTKALAGKSSKKPK